MFDFYNKILVIGLDYKKLYKSIFNKSDYIYWISKFESAFKGENIIFETKKLLDNGDRWEPMLAERLRLDAPYR